MSALRFRRILGGAVVAATILVFLPTLDAEFVSWDDESNFLENLHFRGLGLPNLHWMWTTTLLGHYVPLSWMTLGADYVVWGMNPAGYHLTNLLLHAANALFVYLIALRVLAHDDSMAEARPVTNDRVLAASLAALLFSLHPLRVESVAWVTERRDVLSGLFFFASILAYLRYAQRDPETWRRPAYAASIGLFVCSALSKATAMTLPAVLFVLNVYPLQRLGAGAGWWSSSGRRVYAELTPFALVAAAAAAVSLVALHPGPQLSLGGKVAVSAYSLVFYVWKTVLPSGLSPLYPMPHGVDPSSPRFLASYVLVLAAGIVLWKVRRRFPATVVCTILFGVVTLPMLGIVQNGPQIAADRYTYAAGPALSTLAAAGLFSISALGRRGQMSAGAAVVVLLGTLTWRQANVWHDSTSLWLRVLSVDDNSSFAHVGMGRLAFARGDLDGAILHYRRAVETDPSYFEGYNNLGNALAREGRLPEAIAEYRRALIVHPDFPEAHNDLGNVLARQGDLTEALVEYQAALALRPAYGAALNDLGVALAQLNKLDLAIEQYRRAIDVDSTLVDAHINLGDALDRLGDLSGAEAEFSVAGRYRPDDPDLRRNRGVVLAQERRFKEAAAEFRRALELRPGDAEIARYLNLAMEHAARQPE